MRVGLSSSNAPCVTASQRLCAGAPEGAQTRSPRRIEGLHLTRKKWLRHQPAAHTLTELQAQLDAFRTYYNTVRPHRALHRRTPAEAYTARPEATATGIPLIDGHYRVRHDGIDINDKLTVFRTCTSACSAPAESYCATGNWTGPGTTDHSPQRERCRGTPVNGVPRHRRSVRGATSYIAQRIPLRRR